jgi:hypothetical protein
MSSPLRTQRRAQWRKTREQGMPRFIAIGALRRGVPMGALVLLALEIMEGGSFTAERFASGAFVERVLFVFAVFLAGGALSAFGRWKSNEALHGDGSST